MDRKEMGRRLALECNRCDYTGSEIARLSGCSRRTWINYEQGATKIDAIMLSKLDQLGFDVLYIVTGRRSKAV